MALQQSVRVRNAQANTIQSTAGASPTLEIRSGVMPADCATAAVGTVLATMALPATWLGAAAAGVVSLAGSWADAAADASGIAGYFRITGTGSVVDLQGLVSEQWVGSRLYPVGFQSNNGGNIYRVTTSGTSAASGGPSGAGGAITDGGVTWAYVQTGTDMVIANATINAGQGPISVTSCTITMGGA